MVEELRRTICNRDCPDACGIVASVEDGVVRKIVGDPDHPITKGFLCFRTSRFPARLTAPDRVRRPLLRDGRGFREVDPEEALDFAAEKLLRIRAEAGPAAIFHYRSGGSLGLLKGLADRFFEDFGPCATKIGNICNGAGEAAQEADFGVSDSNDLFDLLNARHILLWGKNPVVSSVHAVPVLKKARAQGARVLLIDPVHHRGAALADEMIQLRPGGDLALALGVGRVLFEEGWIDGRAGERCDHLASYRKLVHSRSAAQWAAAAGASEEELRGVAGALADGPTAILVGWGLQRRQRGGAIVRALDALSAVSGNLYRSGGGCSFYFKRRAAFREFQRGVSVAPRTIREPLFGRDVLAAEDPPIRAIWVTAGNPVCMLPDAARVAEALEKTEFVTVVDPFMTDTARRADLVLPVPTLLEDEDLLGAFGHHWLGRSRPVVPPPPDAWHEVRWLQGLARRVGLEGVFPMGSLEELQRELLADSAVELEALDRGAVRDPAAAAVLFGDGRVPTANGRVQLLTEMPELELAEPPGKGPRLWLFSNSTAKNQGAQWAGRGLGDRIWVVLHPEAVPGLREGQEVVIESTAGSLIAVLRLDEKQRRDVAIVPKGGHFDRGQCANSLIPARTSDLGLGAAYLDCLVTVQAFD